MNPHDLAIEAVVTIKAGEVAMWQCRVLICIVYECMTAESQRYQTMYNLGLLLLPLLGTLVRAANYSAPLRPQVHFSPPHGFMNDPNGLHYDSKRGVYHYYYQRR